MSERVYLTIPDDHYKWLENVRKSRGWDSVQDAIRSVIEDAFRVAMGESNPIILKAGGDDPKEKAVIQTL